MSTTTSARVMATDEKTGRKYVKTQTVEGAAVTVTKFSGEEVDGSYRWTSAAYDVIAPGGEVFAGSIKWDGKAFKVGTKPAASLSKAVRAVLGTEQLAAPKKDARPSTRTRKSAATRKPKAAEVSGSSVIEADPDTGLPRIKPGVQDKADAIVAAQLARNAEAGK
jgi:hypothetical protein